MKVCPVCSETFGDDLKFCDLDGTRLDREGGNSIRDPNKLWSILGVGLLVGALVISAATVLFFPQADITPSLATPGIEPLGNSTVSGDTGSPTADYGQREAAQPEAIANLIVPSELKEEKTGATDAEKSTKPEEDPKAAAKDEEKTEATDGATGDAALTPPNPKKPATPVKSAGDTSDSNPAAKTSKPAAGTKDAKADSAKAGEKEADSKKKDKKDEKDDKKKKGGFFGVFKKIFGKN